MGGDEALCAADPILQRVVIRRQVENHDIAIAGRAEQIHPILICL